MVHEHIPTAVTALTLPKNQLTLTESMPKTRQGPQDRLSLTPYKDAKPRQIRGKQK